MKRPYRLSPEGRATLADNAASARRNANSPKAAVTRLERVKERFLADPELVARVAALLASAKAEDS
ncbi:hypothetical protein [Streptomyces mirabilis]|uniref:hypothetical protein n=1 Tax=Streptomyces mirabilis TaxID=68239 RepID=UPI00331B203E